MGPTLIFDKSTLESLNPNESLWLDHFYLCNITPMFYVETLADLEKNVRHGRTPESVVGNIANKTPEDGVLNVHYLQLLYHELEGNNIIMDGRSHPSGSQKVELGDRKGVIIRDSKEEEAFKRWHKGEFLEVERLIAKKWRREIVYINKNDTECKDIAEAIFGKFRKPDNLEDIKKEVDNLLNIPGNESFLKFCFSLLNIPSKLSDISLKNWKMGGQKSIREFIPYFSYIVSVELFFYIANAFNLLSMLPHKETQKIDLAYLYYLPFCNIFTSNDKFHIHIVPLFLEDNQTFISGEDLKADLSNINLYYSLFPEEVKNTGITTFALFPPTNKEFILTTMWDKYMSDKWRDMEKGHNIGNMNSNFSENKELLKNINQFEKEAKPCQNINNNQEDLNEILVVRKIRASRGDWQRFSQDVINAGKNI
ncbi:MAG: hypothetical protein PHN31_06180 [Candidatus Gracilibacteria bacterium]|nr:hypothetical protein [Candidatus Gracilibacteria bacterium]